MTMPGQPGPGPGNAPDATPKVISGSDQAANEAVAARQRTPSAGQDPPAGPAQPAHGPADLSAEAAELEQRLAEVRAKASGQDTVRVKVEEPHSGLIHNGLYVGTDWTDVPVHALPAMMEGAANAGVTLTQEETES